MAKTGRGLYHLHFHAVVCDNNAIGNCSNLLNDVIVGFMCAAGWSQAMIILVPML
jgi:hypothetical protein